MYVDDRVVRKRGHPQDEQLFHYNVKGSHWGHRVEYMRGIGYVGDGVSKHLQDPPPFQGRKKQQGNSPLRSSQARAAQALYSMRSDLQKSRGFQRSTARDLLLKKASKIQNTSSGSSGSSSSGGGGSSSSGSKYSPELRAKLDELRANSEASKKEQEKEKKKQEAEAKKQAAAEERERRRQASEAAREQKARDASEKKAYREKLAIERQARQLFEKWKQEEVNRQKKKDNTLKKSQVSFVADKGKARSWNGPKRSRTNKMI